MHLKHTALATLSALALAGAAAGIASAAPSPPAGASEISGTIIWHERVARGEHRPAIGILLNSAGGDILVTVPDGTPIYRKYWGVSDPSELHTGDTLTVWGVANGGGSTSVFRAEMVQDAAIQSKGAEATGQVLFRDDGSAFIQVTGKPDGSPIGSVLVAARRDDTKITLPNGQPGGWADVVAGRTVEAGGTYDDATHTMFDPDHIHIVS